MRKKRNVLKLGHCQQTCRAYGGQKKWVADIAAIFTTAEYVAAPVTINKTSAGEVGLAACHKQDHKVACSGAKVP
eukprot:139500-Amphidinium_carterae.2